MLLVLAELGVVGAVDAAATHEFGAATGEHVDRAVVLGEADGVVVGKEGDGGGEAQGGGALRDGGEDRRGRREDVLAEVVLAEME